ncbi:CPBP family intramembrane glutamic endopeptidase [Microlunatus soli]|uniref:CAAX prenyl protease 2/Lysostaphin resistance protein A-like domain-containing protein n=1 Tax=Microlunatus soli TaxID=630515 RepID=A0A1H1YN04_9ACTN|nr:type II CAAX endopeptidase family protein [Microlunatus soli]SDT22795.1 hypothetical protein SAMN04489812_4679 [Microlunatus soli]
MIHSSPSSSADEVRLKTRPRPGWPELGIGLAVLLILEVGLARAALTMHLGAVVTGVFMTALSAIVAGGGFAAAALTRVRSTAAFGLVATSWKWILVGVGGGIVATALKIPATKAFTAIFGAATSSQTSWSAAGAGGLGAVLLSFLFLGVLTPIGEELFFRGVVTTVLLRYGAVVGVVGSTVLFAVLHGEPVLMISAVLVGLPAAELRRRTGSIWPGVALHITFDLISSIGLFIVLPNLTH